MTRLALILSAALFACGSGTKSTQKPVATVDAESKTGTERPTDADPGSPLSEVECSSLLRHVLDIGVVEMRAVKPANEVPTEEQVVEIHAQMTGDPEKMARCAQQPRWAYDCAMAAKTSAALVACEGDDEASRDARSSGTP